MDANIQQSQQQEEQQPARKRRRRRPAWQRKLIKYWPPVRFGLLAVILLAILVLIITLIFI